MIHPSKSETHPSNPRYHLAPPERTNSPQRTIGGTDPTRGGSPESGPTLGNTADPVSGRWPYGGFARLPFVVERGAGQPASDATWAWSLRRFARAAVWVLPGYAIVYGSVTLVGSGSAPFLAQPRAAQLLGWIGALWLGLLGVMAVASLLVAARSRMIATAGLLVALAGTMLLLPFGGLPGETAAFGTTGRIIAVSGGVLYSLGWWLIGLAVFRSGVFSRADGTLLMIAAPLLGVGGLLVAALHSLGAVLVLTAGIGVAWRAGRLVPPVARATLTRASTPGAVAAVVPTDRAVVPTGGGVVATGTGTTPTGTVPGGGGLVPTAPPEPAPS